MRSSLRPQCIDCGETDREKFYAHPTKKTGVQSRCKQCDNKNRVQRCVGTVAWEQRRHTASAWSHPEFWTDDEILGWEILADLEAEFGPHSPSPPFPVWQ